jgi:hypothetical protein
MKHVASLLMFILVEWATASLVRSLIWGSAPGPPSLSDVCTSEITHVHISSVNALLRSGTNASLFSLPTFGIDSGGCRISIAGTVAVSAECAALKEGIKACQARGIKVLLVVQNTQLPLMASDSDGSMVAKRLFAAFISDDPSRLYFAGVRFDGLDLRIADTPNGYPGLVSTLSTLLLSLQSRSPVGSRMPILTGNQRKKPVIRVLPLSSSDITRVSSLDHDKQGSLLAKRTRSTHFGAPC